MHRRNSSSQRLTFARGGKGIMTSQKKTENEEIAKEVKSEVEIMMRLNHPHIIKLLDHFETKDKVRFRRVDGREGGSG